MTTNEPASGNSPRMSDTPVYQTPPEVIEAMKPDVVRARIAQFSEWFGIPPVKLSVRKGHVIMTDELVNWCGDEGASIDWICCGIAKGMAQVFRERHAGMARLTGALRKLDEAERQIFEACMKDLNAKIEAHRAASKGAA